MQPKEYVQSEIRRAKDEYGVAYFPGMFSEIAMPTWDDFIQDINIKRQRPENDFHHPDYEVYLGHVTKRTDADFYFYSGGSEGKLKETTDLMEKILRDDYSLGEILNGGPVSTGAFVNFAVEGFNVPLHGDDRDTIFVQCIGKTTWTLYASIYHDPGLDKTGHSTHLATITLDPGDMIYIGHRVQHSVEIIEPRAGLAFKGTI